MAEDSQEILIPLEVAGQAVYLAVERLPGEEEEISSRRPSLEQALDGLAGVAQVMGAKLQDSRASKVGIEFGCEFALESGSFVAVIGKATARSTFKVTLEWTKPPT